MEKFTLKNRPDPDDYPSRYRALATKWFSGFEKDMPHKLTVLKDELGTFFRDYDLPSILKGKLFELVDDWAQKEILGC